MPLISVVIPAFNAERTILETVKSVQQQTFVDFEVLVINDGSSDRTIDIVAGVKDERIKTFSYQNAGVSVARNRGIAHASGDFIAFLDADDLWAPDKLSMQLTALQQHPEAGVAYSWTHFVDDAGKFLHASEPIFYEGDVYAKLLARNFLSNGSNPLIRRQAIESVGEFDSSITSCEDWDYWLRLAARWSFVVVPKPQILYRQTSGAKSSRINSIEEEAIKVIEKAFLAAPAELQHLKNQNLANLYQYLTSICLARANDIEGVEQARQNLQKAIYLHPQILLDRTTQRYFAKCLLMRLLSPKVAKHFTRPVSKLARSLYTLKSKTTRSSIFN